MGSYVLFNLGWGVDLTSMAILLSAGGTAFAGGSMWLLSQQIKRDQEWNRRKAAHDLLFTSANDLRGLRLQMDRKIDIYDSKQTYSTIAEQLDVADHQALDGVLNFIENLCTAVKNGVVDEDLIYSAYGGIVLAYWRWAEPYIQKEREKHPLLWIEIVPYVESWRIRTTKRLHSSIEPRKLPL